jgi:hypothetical protein
LQSSWALRGSRRREAGRLWRIRPPTERAVENPADLPALKGRRAIVCGAVFKSVEPLLGLSQPRHHNERHVRPPTPGFGKVLLVLPAVAAEENDFRIRAAAIQLGGRGYFVMVICQDNAQLTG